MFRDPLIGDSININGGTYRFTETPNAPGIIYAEIGRKAKVYRVLNGSQAFALKAFKPKYRILETIGNTPHIAKFQNVRGLAVAGRTIISPDIYPEIVQRYEGFAYAVLMPWVEGKSWFNFVTGKVPLTHGESSRLAHSLVDTVWELEQRDLAHCDLSSSNFIFSADFSHVELIDIEDMFAYGLLPPKEKPKGTGGYAPSWVRENGVWEAGGDRFSTGILVSEVLGWQYDDVREASSGDAYFAEGEFGNKSKRFRLISDHLEQMHPELSNLFKMVWYAESLEECPRVADWKRVLDSIQEPILEVSPDHLNFGVLDLTTKPPFEHQIALRVRNVGGGVLGGIIQSNVTWLSVFPSNFSLHPSETLQVTASLNQNVPHPSGNDTMISSNSLTVSSNGGMQWLESRLSVKTTRYDFLWKWISVSILSFAIFSFGAILVTENSSTVGLLLLPFSLIFMAIAEWMILRRSIRYSGWWILATILGLPISIFGGAWLSSLVGSNTVLGNSLGFAFIGVAEGLIGFLILRRSLSRSWIYIISNSLAWLVIGWLILGFSYLETSMALLPFALAGLAHGIITGLGIRLFLKDNATTQGPNYVTISAAGPSDILKVVGIGFLTGLSGVIIGAIPTIIRWILSLSSLQIGFGIAVIIFLGCLVGNNEQDWGKRFATAVVVAIALPTSYFVFTWIGNLIGSVFSFSSSSSANMPGWVTPVFGTGFIIYVGGILAYFAAQGLSGMDLGGERLPKLWAILVNIPLMILTAFFILVAYKVFLSIQIRTGTQVFGIAGFALGTFFAASDSLRENSAGGVTLRDDYAGRLRFMILLSLNLLACASLLKAITNLTGTFVTIPATAAWTGSGAPVNKGDMVLIMQTAGAWSADPTNSDLPFLGAEGYTSSSDAAIWAQFPSLPLGALIAATSDNPNLVSYVGRMNIIRAQETGSLYFEMNDSSLYNNSGTITIWLVDLNRLFP